MGAVGMLDVDGARALIQASRSGLNSSEALVDVAERQVPVLGRDLFERTERLLEAGPRLPGRFPVADTAVAKKNVMITYLSAGNGHRTAAESLYGRLCELFPQWEIARPVDMANLSKHGKAAAALFYKTVDWGIWPWIYEHADKAGMVALLQRLMERFGNGKFIDLVAERNPDMIVHTNFLGAELQSVARDQGKISPRIENLQIITDNDGHGSFLRTHADITFVPNDQVAQQLIQKGMDPDQIVVSGIPINSIFSQKPVRSVVRSALGFSPDAQVLLVQGNLIKDTGSYGRLMQNLAAAYPDGVNGRPIEVAIACGKDDKLLAALSQMAKSYTGKVQLKPVGLLSQPAMRDYMRAANLSLTKPGGLTTAESVAMDLPMVLIDVMGGGQETHNAEYFTRQGASVTAHDFDEAIQQVVRLVADPSKLNAMSQAAARVANPDAATKVGQVMAHLPVAVPQTAGAAPRPGWLTRAFDAIFD